MSTFTNHGVANYASASTTTHATSHTIDINNSSGTTAGDAGVIVVAGSFNFYESTIATYFRTQFLDSSSNVLTTWYSVVSTLTYSYLNSGQSGKTYADNNIYTPHSKANADTNYNGNRSSFLYHISVNPSTSSTHPKGFMYCTGTYWFNYDNAQYVPVVSYPDMKVKQDNTSNKVDKMRFTAMAGNLDNFNCKVFRLGAR